MDRIGRYRLGELLGQGGAGSVYAGVLEGPGGFEREVAVKVLAGSGEGLQREARLGGLLRHAHLVDVFEVGEEDGQWFCAMERCLGSLSDHLPLPPSAVVDVGLQVCDALTYAHDALGLVHLDLKPDNLLYAEHGVVRVADLGVASAQSSALGDDDGRLWLEGQVRGTPGFMPPEQARGGWVDARSDVFALGATLRQLATGRHSSSHAPSTWVDDGLDAPPAQAPEPSRTTPAWLEAVYARCTASLPADRYPTMAALRQALLELDVSGPTLAEHLGLAAHQVEAFDARIPDAVDAFVGRQPDLDALGRLLEVGGVVTLRGPAGVGKTRLALQAARRWQANPGSTALFLDLSPVQRPEGLLFELGRALEVMLAGGGGVTQLGAALRARGPLLLLLDNLEQLDGADAPIRELAAAAPEARLLLTSRRPMGIPTEVVYDVEPLPPAEAVGLLVARAHLRGVELAPTAELAELAEHLDGLPLALELAAGRLGVLSVRDVRERLEQGVLRSAARGSRHATLEAALQWGWDLLQPSQRQTLATLSVFEGSFSLEAAEHVVGTGSAFDDLDALVERSLVRAEGRGRFRLLVSVRHFAAGKLAEGASDGPSAEALERRHAQFYATRWGVGLLRRLDRQGGPELGDISRSLPNLRAATERAVARGDGSTALACLRAMWQVMENGSSSDDYLGLCQSVVDCGGMSPSEHAVAELICGVAHSHGGDLDTATAYYLSAIDRAEAAGATHTEALSRSALGNVLLLGGQPEASVAAFDAAIEVHRRNGDVVWSGLARSDRAVALQQLGRMDEAIADHRATLRAARRVGDRATEGTGLGNLGVVHMEGGALDLAQTYLEAAVELHTSMRRWKARANTLGNLGLVHAVAGRLDVARAIMEESLEAHTQLGQRRFQGIMMGNLGLLHERQGRREQALRHITEALELARRASNRRFVAYWLAWLARLDPHHSSALDRAEEAVSVATAVGDPATLAEVRAMRAGVLVERGELTAARAELDAARAEQPPVHQGAHTEISRVEAMLGETRT